MELASLVLLPDATIGIGARVQVASSSRLQLTPEPLRASVDALMRPAMVSRRVPQLSVPEKVVGFEAQLMPQSRKVGGVAVDPVLEDDKVQRPVCTRHEPPYHVRAQV